MTTAKHIPSASFSEIDHALNTLDHAFYCNWCQTFSDHDTKYPGGTCPVCESTDETYNTEDLTVYLEEQAEAAWIAGQQAVERKSA